MKPAKPFRTTRITSLLPLLLLLLTLPAAVQAQYNYLTNNGAITITRYDCSSGAVGIPSTMNGLPVTRIGDGAFSGCTSLTSVTIGNGVTSIGGSAFSGCTSLTGVMIGNSVRSIGDSAFFGCTSLTSVTIGNGVTSIGDSAFSGCTGLNAITVEARNAVYSSVDGVLFNRSQTTLIQYPRGKAGSFTIPNSVTSISDGAFYGCTGLSALTVEALNSFYSSLDGVLFNRSQTTLIQYPGGKAGSYTIPNSVTTIGYYAFSGCTGLTSVTIPNSVTSIGVAAFFGCTSLTSVTISHSVIGIGGSAFSGCTGLTAVYFKGNTPSSGEYGVFRSSDNVIVYYLPGTMGWDSMFSGRPAVLWNSQVLTSDAIFGVHAGQFGFTIAGTSGLVVVVEASADLANPIWSPVGTYTLTGVSSYFSDPQWTNHPAHFYRLRSP